MTEQPKSYLSPKLAYAPLPEKGFFGVFARESIPAGELLVMWAGELVHTDGLAAIPDLLRSRSIQVEDDLFLVPTQTEPADFINHSCDPNAALSGQIALVARRDIAPGEEICYDYAMSDGSAYDEFECRCGAAVCRGHVNGDDWRRPELQERYRGHFSPYLQRRIEQATDNAGHMPAAAM
ncbi:MAG: SET domain-containing protein [Anaerolineae bacterium]|nr:SET domain-containing protein [Anaerolineae bacterium]